MASAALASTKSIVRGSPARATEFMEAFQLAYLRAICAAAGCVIFGKPEIDEGIDVMISHTADVHTAHSDRRAMLQIQLKATSKFDLGKSTISAVMSANRFREFAVEGPTVSKMVVIMALPHNFNEWVYSNPRATLLRHSAYWVNLEGRDDPATESVTVHAPYSQPLTVASLCELMCRIGVGLKP